MTAARVHRSSATRESLAREREGERRRLARELHDGPAQSLSAALFGVDLALASFARTPAAAHDEMVRARELLREALDELRSLMAGLRPRILEERGLTAALEALAGATPLWGPAVVVTVSGLQPGDRLPDELELGLYRIAQEAVSNARRHSAAARVTVTLMHSAGNARLEIQDNGHGMPPQRLRPTVAQGQGLPGMRERAALLGGELSIESVPGAGTTVLVTVPLPVGGAGLREGEA